jgi:hypothetical protein
MGLLCFFFAFPCVFFLVLDHTKLTYRFQGREYRLTDVFGDVVHGILA